MVAPSATLLRERHDLALAARWGAADRAVVEATLARLTAAGAHDDPDAWLREWTAAGGAARAAGAALHASSYYAAALGVIGATDGTVHEDRLWERQRACWEQATRLLGAQQLEIPYEATTLPGFFFSAGDAKRPLLVIDPGADTVTSSAWARGGAAARARGWHWMAFDGPGRQAAWRCQGLALRPDWGVVLGAVADAMVARAEVDPARIGLLGLDDAGCSVVRGLADEHRFAAAAVAPELVDPARALYDALPAPLRAALDNQDEPQFARELHLVSLFAPDVALRVVQRAAPYGPAGCSTYQVYRRMPAFRLGDEVAQIATPLLVAGPLRGEGAVVDWLASFL
jgi:hypothetical protein